MVEIHSNSNWINATGTHRVLTRIKLIFTNAKCQGLSLSHARLCEFEERKKKRTTHNLS